MEVRGRKRSEVSDQQSQMDDRSKAHVLLAFLELLVFALLVLVQLAGDLGEALVDAVGIGYGSVLELVGSLPERLVQDGGLLLVCHDEWRRC